MRPFRILRGISTGYVAVSNRGDGDLCRQVIRPMKSGNWVGRQDARGKVGRCGAHHRHRMGDYPVGGVLRMVLTPSFLSAMHQRGGERAAGSLASQASTHLLRLLVLMGHSIRDTTGAGT